MTNTIKVNKAARNAAGERINVLWKQLVREIEWAILREAIDPDFSATHIILDHQRPDMAVGVSMATAPMPRQHIHEMLARSQARFGRPEVYPRTPNPSDDDASD